MKKPLLNRLFYFNAHPILFMDKQREKEGLKSSLKISAILIIGVFVVLGVIVAHEMQYVDESKAYDSRANYAYVVSDTFPGISDFGKPDADETLVIISFTIANDSYESGIHTDWWSVGANVTINGIVYSGASISTTDHVLYRDVTILPGAQASSITMVEIPKSLANQPMEIDLGFRNMGQWEDGTPNTCIDETLSVPAPV